jgi:hypothetical protein
VDAAIDVLDGDEVVSGPDAFGSAAVSAADELEEMVTAGTDDDELPWLAASSDESAASDEVAAIAEALEEDARASGEADDVAVLDRSEPAAGPIEASFADVMPAVDDDEERVADRMPPDQEGSTAFVTETMGELLVAQGLTAQAVSVYEELVRRRPYDPVVSSRLAELRELLAPEPEAAAPVASAPAVATEEPHAVFTARERFRLLAARRAPRGAPVPDAQAPAVSAADVSRDDSLAALFGGEPMPEDDASARSLAAAFESVPEASTTASFFAATPASGTVRQPTPLRPLTPMRAATPIGSAAVPGGGDFSFDRFFPDPAGSGGTPVGDGGQASGDATPSAGAPSAGDDLAQFSAWLKGLGNT